jgi:hypothetical protein
MAAADLPGVVSDGFVRGKSSRYLVMSHKLTPRQVIARSYPTWDYAMADRLIAWLEHCGYEIVNKGETVNDDAGVMIDEQAPGPQLAQVC